MNLIARGDAEAAEKCFSADWEENRNRGHDSATKVQMISQRCPASMMEKAMVEPLDWSNPLTVIPKGSLRTPPQTVIAGCRATLAFIARRIIFPVMATIAEVEKLALDLPESQRAVLAAHLLGSLPSVLHDEDEGIAEALRRDAELDSNPLAGISLEQLDRQIERRRS